MGRNSSSTSALKSILEKKEVVLFVVFVGNGLVSEC